MQAFHRALLHIEDVVNRDPVEDFAMVFTLHNGKVTEFQEFTDSAAVNAAYAVGATV
jgi:ketosteroid isomerase-like protein